MNKKIIRASVVCLILLAILHVIVFVIPFRHNGAFWLSYVFSLIAFVVLGAAAYLSKGEDAKSKFYGFPILRIGVIYFAVQIVVGLIVMMIAVVPVWVAAVVYVILLGVAGLGLVAADSMREEIERQDTVLKKNTSMMLSLRSKAGAMPGLSEDAETKKVLTHLAESFRFSDPVSSDELAEIEQDLVSLLDEIQKALLENDLASVKTLCKQTELKLVERNRLCKLNK